MKPPSKGTAPRRNKPGAGRPVTMTDETRKKTRAFTTTDAEWAAIRAKATEGKLSVGRYIAQEILGADHGV